MFLLVLLFVASFLSAEASHPDGYDWGKWNQSVKIGFVMGWIEATHSDGALALSICISTADFLDTKKCWWRAGIKYVLTTIKTRIMRE